MTVTILTGDCRTILPTLPSESVQCVVTSPPYFGLRDYGTAQWEGGDGEAPDRARRAAVFACGGSGLMLVYIAGPLSHADVLHQERNVERAMAVAHEVMERGHQPVVPHLTHYLDCYWHTEMGDSVEYETWIAWALALLERCDIMLYMGSSPGADRELTHAIQIGIPVYGSAGDLP